MLPYPKCVVEFGRRASVPVRALLSHGGTVARRRPFITALAIIFLLVAGAIAGFYAYAHHKWHAAQVAVKENRLAEAHADLDVCLFFWPRDVEVRLLAARAARLSGEFEEAESQLNRCLRLQGGSSQATQLEFLLMRVQTGEIDDVAAQLMEYVGSQHPESPLILETMARAYMYNVRYGLAYACLNRWINEVPDAAKAFQWRGWVGERMNNVEGALRDYLRSLELEPDQDTIRLRVAEIYLERTRLAEALPHLEFLRKQFPRRPDVLGRLGQYYSLRGQPEEARHLLEQAIAQLPDDPLVLTYLAKLDLQEGRAAQAEKWLRHLLKLDPADPEAQYNLAASLQLQGRDKEAKATLDQYEKNLAMLRRQTRLLQDEADRPTTDPNVAYEVGSIFLAIGQDRLGLFWLDEALKRDPGHEATNRALAEYYEKKGEPAKAAPHRRRLAESKGKSS
jgi:tetratricopeptide (TPR) repeat protein